MQREGGITAMHYHAGMTNPERTKVQNAWRSGAVQVPVVTPPPLPIPQSVCNSLTHLLSEAELKSLKMA